MEMVKGAVTGLLTWFRTEKPRQFYLELGRSGRTETMQETPLDDHYLFFKLPADYCEGPISQPVSTMIKSCCKVADVSGDFYALIYTKEWLRTVIKLDEPVSTSERNDLQPVVPQLAVASDLKACSNVVPRHAYLKRREGVIQANCQPNGSKLCTGGFFPIGSLSAGEPKPFQPCSECYLTKELGAKKNSDGEDSNESGNSLREIILEKPHIESRKTIIGLGNEAEVLRINLPFGTFALKRFLRNNSSDAKFNRRCEIAFRVSHPNIVRCFGKWSDASHYGFFMELLEDDLQGFLNDETNRDPDGSPSAFSFRDSLVVLLQVAEAVKHLHENHFLHGDLKPSNILVSKLAMPHADVPFYLVKVADFGCMKPINVASAPIPETVESWAIGSSIYRAPEVLRCHPIEGSERGPVPEHDQLEKIDVYSFGFIAYQVITGDTIESSLGPNLDILAFQEILDGKRFKLLEYVSKCWGLQPEGRPSFSEICAKLLELERMDSEQCVDLEQKGPNAKYQLHSILRNLRCQMSLSFASKGFQIVVLGLLCVFGPRVMRKCRNTFMC